MTTFIVSDTRRALDLVSQQSPNVHLHISTILFPSTWYRSSSRLALHPKTNSSIAVPVMHDAKSIIVDPLNSTTMEWTSVHGWQRMEGRHGRGVILSRLKSGLSIIFSPGDLTVSSQGLGVTGVLSVFFRYRSGSYLYPAEYISGAKEAFSRLLASLRLELAKRVAEPQLTS